MTGATDGPLLSVIIVSYNTAAMTLDCLRDLYADLKDINAEVIVVDNDSQDGSAKAIKAAFPQVHLIASDRNLGFGAANNRAMDVARGRYLMLLNSDAFIRPATASTLCRYLDEHPTVGVVGPRLLNKDGTTQRSCFRYPTPTRAWIENLWLGRFLSPHAKLGDYRGWAHDQSLAVDWVVGACLVVRREVVKQVGGFDERFFMYAEETDWQRRIRDGGWEIHFTPEVEVVHLGGASGAAERARVNAHFFDSLDRYQCKHHGRGGLVALRLAMALGSLLRLSAWAGAYVLRPARRAEAVAKLRLHRWLLIRQLFHWPRGTAG